MSRRKVKPTQLARRRDRQGSLPAGREQQASRKRGERSVLPASRRRTKHRGKRLRSPSLG